MADDILRKVYVHTTPDSYRNFLSDDWAARIDALTSPAPKLSALVLDVVLDWRAAAYAVSLPAMLPEQVKGYHDSFVNSGEINTTLLRLAEGICRKLVRRIPELTSDPALIRRLQTEIVNLGSDLEMAKSGTEIELPLDELWQEYIKLPAFYLGLWGSQRIGYVSIYNAYDNFVVEMVKLALSPPRCRSSEDGFKKLFADAFGEPLKAKCWTDSRLNIARVARHALSHAAGRVTKELDDLRPKHSFVVEDGRIQITPDDTKHLYSLLKDCVYALAEKAVAMPQFR